MTHIQDALLATTSCAVTAMILTVFLRVRISRLEDRLDRELSAMRKELEACHCAETSKEPKL